MNVKIKHNYSNGASSMNFSLQHPNCSDGDDGRVITATIYNAPSAAKALHASRIVIFFPKLKSCDYSQLKPGRIFR